MQATLEIRETIQRINADTFNRDRRAFQRALVFTRPILPYLLNPDTLDKSLRKSISGKTSENQ